MAPDLLFYPVPDEREALAGVSDRKVVHPTAQYRVDELYNPIHWLRLAASEHILEFPQQCRSFLEFRRIEWSAYAPATANTAEIAHTGDRDHPFQRIATNCSDRSRPGRRGC